MRASAADAVTEVLLPNLAAAWQFIPARPYCLSGLHEKLYPCNLLMSTPATTDFATFEAAVICSEPVGGSLPVKIQPPSPREPRVSCGTSQRADRGQDDRRKNQDEKREVVPRAARPGGHPAARRRSRTAAAIETVPAAGGLAGSTAVPVRAAGSPSSRQGHRAPGGGQLPDPWRAIRGGGTPRGTNARWRRAGARCGAQVAPKIPGSVPPASERPAAGVWSAR